jgi:hypothetical protein
MRPAGPLSVGCCRELGRTPERLRSEDITDLLLRMCADTAHEGFFAAASRLIRAQLRPGEAGVAEGRVEEVRSEFEQGLSYIVVADERVVFGLAGDSDTASLPFDDIRSYSEASHGDRWYLHLRHNPIARRRHRTFWEPYYGPDGPDAYDTRPEDETFLRFSRRNTAAARAILAQLKTRGIPQINWSASRPENPPPDFPEPRPVEWGRIDFDE